MDRTADGSEPRRLTTVKGWADNPVFSPDGKRIRFTVVDSASHTAALFEVRSDGSDLHPLLSNWHNPPHECCGTWTPNGLYYLFRSTPLGSFAANFGDIFAVCRTAPASFAGRLLRRHS